MESWSKHWHVIVYLVGLVFVGGMTFADNKAQEDDIKANKVKIEKDAEKVKEVDDRLIRIEEAQKNTAKDVDEIKQDVKDILKELRER
jgi:septal ring factor EnvC (AmiA/AmiB activator)